MYFKNLVWFFCFVSICAFTNFKYEVKPTQAVNRKACVVPKDLISLSQALDLPIKGPYDIALRPDGQTLAVSNTYGIVFYDVKTLEVVQTLSLEDFPFGGMAIDWSPNGQKLAANVVTGRGIHIWDTTISKLERVLLSPEDQERIGISDEDLSVAWSPEGSQLAETGSLPARVWDVLTGEMIFEMDYGAGLFMREYANGLPELIAWSPDGRFVAFPNKDSVEIWDTETQTLTKSLTGIGDEVHGIDWSGDGLLAVSDAKYTVHIWDTSTWEVRQLALKQKSYRQYSYALKWSPDNTLLAIGATDIKFWDAKTGEIVDALPEQGADVYNIEWLPDGKRLFSRIRNGTVFLWNLETKCLEAMLPPTSDEIAETFQIFP